MRKLTIVLSLFLVLVLVLLTACADTSNYTLDYGASQIYSEEDIESAAKVVVNKFNSFQGCVLYSLAYAGDEVCQEELSYCNSLKEDAGEEFVECLVFYSEFRSPVKGGGAWTPNDIYTWDWYLGRETDGKWVLVTYGY